MKKSIFLILSLLVYISLQAQTLPDSQINFVSVLSNINETHSQARDISKYDILDSAFMTVSYFLNYRQDPQEKLPQVTSLVLQIGPRYTCCYSSDYRNIDSILLNAVENNRLPPPAFVYTVPVGEVYRNLETGEMNVLHRMPWEKHYVVYYREASPGFSWQITEDTATVAGYLCRKATASFRGRTWNSWFTTDIPANAGPWKFQGLPGLILKAEDSERDFTFTCYAIEQKQTPIVRYRWDYQKMSPEAWKKLEKSYHFTPYFHFSRGGPYIFFTRGIPGKQLDVCWQIFYNPIER